MRLSFLVKLLSILKLFVETFKLIHEIDRVNLDEPVVVVVVVVVVREKLVDNCEGR